MGKHGSYRRLTFMGLVYTLAPLIVVAAVTLKIGLHHIESLVSEQMRAYVDPYVDLVGAKVDGLEKKLQTIVPDIQQAARSSTDGLTPVLESLKEEEPSLRSGVVFRTTADSGQVVFGHSFEIDPTIRGVLNKAGRGFISGHLGVSGFSYLGIPVNNANNTSVLMLQFDLFPELPTSILADEMYSDERQVSVLLVQGRRPIESLVTKTAVNYSEWRNLFRSSANDYQEFDLGGHTLVLSLMKPAGSGLFSDEQVWVVVASTSNYWTASKREFKALLIKVMVGVAILMIGIVFLLSAWWSRPYKLLAQSTDELVRSGGQLGPGLLHYKSIRSVVLAINRLLKRLQVLNQENSRLSRNMNELVEQKTANLAASERYLNTLVKSIDDMLFVIDRNGLIIQSNEISRGFFGLSETELNGINLETLFYPDHKLSTGVSYSYQLRQMVARGEVGAFEASIYSSSGDSMDVMVSSSIFEGDKGHAHAVCIVRDISKIKVAEKQRQQDLSFAQEQMRLASLSGIIESIGDQFKDPLSVAKARVWQFEKMVSNGESKEELLKVVQRFGQVIDRLESVYRGLLYFGQRHQGEEERNEYVHVITRNAVAMCSERALRNQVLIRTEEVDPELETWSDAAGISMVIYSIFDHCIVARSKSEPGEIVVTANKSGNGEVVISINTEKLSNMLPSKDRVDVWQKVLREKSARFEMTKDPSSLSIRITLPPARRSSMKEAV